MCYSGTCRFEDWMGNCTVISDFQKIPQKYGFSPCAMGGFVQECGDEFYEKNKEKIEAAYEKYMSDVKEKQEKHNLII